MSVKVDLDQLAAALDDWRRNLSAEDADRALAVVAAFGLDALYGIESMPRDIDPLHLPSAFRGRGG